MKRIRHFILFSMLLILVLSGCGAPDSKDSAAVVDEGQQLSISSNGDETYQPVTVIPTAAEPSQKWTSPSA